MISIAQYVNKDFLNKNKWIIAASIFFVVWKFFLIGMLWHERVSPPEPDDSYIYTGYINSIRECPKIFCNYPSITFENYTGFTYLSYRLFFGLIAKIFNIDPINLFHYSFYFGILLLLPILLYFLKAITADKNLIALSLLFLALYNGSGAYHGFFWIVPSFFSVALFLLLWAIIMGQVKHWKIAIFLAIPFFVFVHPSSVFSLLVFPIFFVLQSVMAKKIDTTSLKRIGFMLMVALIFYLPVAFYLNSTPQKSPLGVVRAYKTIKRDLTFKKSDQKETNETVAPKNNVPSDHQNKIDPIFKSIGSIKINYADWLFPRSVFIIPFLLMILLLVHYREVKILALYLSLILFVLGSSMNIYGYRSLAYIWPITYVLYAFGFWHAMRFIGEKVSDQKIKTTLNIMIFLALLIFVSINLFYSIFWNRHSNLQNNVRIDPGYATFLKENTAPGEHISIPSKILLSFSLNTSLIESSLVEKSPNSEYYVVLKSDDVNGENKADHFLDVLSEMLGISRQPKKIDSEVKIPKNFELERNIGNVYIYKNKFYQE